MNFIKVFVVRLYLVEGTHLLDDAIHYLKNEAGIRGVTVFRAIHGIGDSGDHSASLIDFSLSLPLVVEFFDDDKIKVDAALTHLGAMVKPRHIVTWEASANT